jgi:outer membrane protein assembly factor BamB
LNTSRVFPTSPRILVSVLLLGVLLLAACGGESGESWAGISANPDGSALYVSYGKRVAALNPATGERLWSYPTKDKQDAQFFAVPVVDRESIYVGDYKGSLHSITLDGVERWVYKPAKTNLIGPISTTPNDRVISGVAVDSDKVYFGLGSRDVVAVSRETAEKVWTFKTGHGVWAMPLYLPANPDDPNSRATLVVVSLDHHLYALDAETGKKLWDKNLGGAAPGGLLYDPESSRVYVGTFLSEMLAIDLDSHEIVARYATDGWVWDPPVLKDGVLYFGDLSGWLYAVRVTDNGFEAVWSQQIAKRAIRATPLLTDGLVVVGSKDKHVYAVSKESGLVQWEKETKGEVLSEMLFVPGSPQDPESSDLVVVATSDRKELLLAYKSESGEVAWRYSD